MGREEHHGRYRADCPEVAPVGKAGHPGHLGLCPVNGFLFLVGALGIKHEGLHLK